MSLSAHQVGGDAARVLVRIAKIVDDDVWENPEAVGPDRELFWPRALKLRSEMIRDGKSVPVRVDHIKTRDIGRVTALSEVGDVDGRWVIAHCDVDEPPGWLCRDTPASMSWCNFSPRTPMPGGWTRHIGGMVTEVSLLSPGKQPAEPGAKVWHIERTPVAPHPVPELPKSAAAPRPVAVATQPVLYRAPKATRGRLEEEELRRRQAWLEDNGYRVSFEDVLDNLKQECGYGRDLSRDWRRHRSAA